LRWARLPPADRGAIAGIFAETADRITAEVRRDEISLLSTFREEGVVVNDIDRDALAKVVEPLLVGQAFPWGADLYYRVSALK
jgi:TRAP-type C4-dicarboxylate transport system substrate-binding protein